MYFASLIFQEPSLLRLHYVDIITDALIAVASLWLMVSLVGLVRNRRERTIRLVLMMLSGFLAALGTLFLTFLLRVLLPEQLWMLTLTSALQEAAAIMGLFAAILMIVQLPRIVRIPDPNADGLTGLPNRMRFDERLEQALNREQMERGSYHFAVLFIDLDGFKLVNDDQGHNVGDELLRAVARRLRRIVRSRDLVARYGGDEFTVLLDGVPNLDYAENIAIRIIETIQEPFVLNGHGVHVGASIGIVTSGGKSNARQIIGAADQAMYRAKTTRPGSYEVWNTAPLVTK
jgi:diguanylate cyclase (GGDEF)-like protein